MIDYDQMYFSIAVSMKNGCLKSLLPKFVPFVFVTFTPLLGSLNGSVFCLSTKYGSKKVVWEKKEREQKGFPRSLSFVGPEMTVLGSSDIHTISSLSMLGAFVFTVHFFVQTKTCSKGEDYLQLCVFHSGSID